MNALNNISPIDEAANILLRSAEPKQQMRAREALRSRSDYFQQLFNIYLANPFLRLTEEEKSAFEEKVRPRALGQLIAARHEAMTLETPKYVIFCMPKSGSSFVQSALRHALQLPLVSLTGFASVRMSSAFGMNSREQELDEAALIKAVLASPDGFIAQHHTRYSQYLGLQMRAHRITPIVMFRNILDCIVSFDDMMTSARTNGTGHWSADPQFALPVEYQTMDPADRYAILTHSFGVWLINFYLSWRRAVAQRVSDPLVIRYRDHVLQPEKLVETLAGGLNLSDAAEARLRDYVREPDRTRSRFNVGRRGRGAEVIPEPLQQFLMDYVAMFRSELSEEDVSFLVR